MSSTNKTTNYDLSQYIGSDKPTYLSDYNGDMSKIDAGMKANADNIVLAMSGIETAQTTATTAQTTANNASTVANSANTKAEQTASDLNTFMQKFNLTVKKSWTGSIGTGDITLSPASTITPNSSNLNITLIKNSDNSMFKLYGTMGVDLPTTGALRIILNNTGLTVDEPYTINPIGNACLINTANKSFQNITVTIENNKITINLWTDINGYYLGVLPACLFFNANFGDSNNNS